MESTTVPKHQRRFVKDVAKKNFFLEGLLSITAALRHEKLDVYCCK